MNKWLQRWQAMATRERWLTYGVALGLLGVLYVLLVGDPLSMRLAKQQSDWQVAEGRRAEAESARLELQRRTEADPNQQYLSALSAAAANRDGLIQQIDQHTAELITPQKMQTVLQELLRKQPQLRVLGMSSFSEPVQLAPTEPAAAPVSADKATPLPALLLLVLSTCPELTRVSVWPIRCRLR